MQKEMKEETGSKAEELLMVYCSRCGKPIGRFGDGSICETRCSNCRKTVELVFREGKLCLTQ